MLTANLHQVPEVKMSGTLPRLPRYAVMWTRIILPLTLPLPLTFQNMSSICFKQVTCKNWHSTMHILELHHHILSHRIGKLNQQFVTDRFRNS